MSMSHSMQGLCDETEEKENESTDKSNTSIKDKPHPPAIKLTNNNDKQLKNGNIHNGFSHTRGNSHGNDKLLIMPSSSSSMKNQPKANHLLIQSSCSTSSDSLSSSSSSSIGANSQTPSKQTQFENGAKYHEKNSQTMSVSGNSSILTKNHSNGLNTSLNLSSSNNLNTSLNSSSSNNLNTSLNSSSSKLKTCRSNVVCTAPAAAASLLFAQRDGGAHWYRSSAVMLSYHK